MTATDTTMRSSEELIASANTTAGFAIGIVRKVAHESERPYYAVVRLDRQSRYVTISRHADERAARRQANSEYRREVAR